MELGLIPLGSTFLILPLQRISAFALDSKSARDFLICLQLGGSSAFSGWAALWGCGESFPIA